MGGSEVISVIFEKVRSDGRKFLLESEAKAICMDYRIPVTEFRVSRSVKEAMEFAEEIGYPVVLKVLSPEVIHKSEVGGIALNLANEGEVQRAFNQILGNVRKNKPEARILGIIVQEMVPPSTEVVVGAVKDPEFGPSLMFGLGGVLVEVLKDVAFRIAPITRQEAREMIKEIKGYCVLEGYRGLPSVDIEAIVEVLVNVSRLVTDRPEIKELDLNPLIVYEKGCKAVDARVILE